MAYMLPSKVREAFLSGSVAIAQDGAPDRRKRRCRNLLRAYPVLSPRVSAETGESPGDIQQCPAFRSFVQVVRVDGHRHCRCRARAWRKRADRRIGTVVSQVIDQNFALATRLCKSRCIDQWIRLHDRLADCARELETRRYRWLRFERNNDVQAAAAGGLYPRRKAQCLEHAAYESRGLDDLCPRDLGARIQVPYESIWMLDVLRGGIPRMDFDDPHLRKRDNSLDRVGDKVLANFRLLLDSNPA